MSEYFYVQIAPKRFSYRTYFFPVRLYVCSSVEITQRQTHTHTNSDKKGTRSHYSYVCLSTHISLPCELARHDTQIAQKSAQTKPDPLSNTRTSCKQASQQPTNLIYLLRQKEHQMIGDSPPPSSSPQPPIY